MRNMSYSETTAQARDRSKTVTRRWGWAKLKPGDRFQQVVKAMGLRKGQKIEKIHVCECVSNRPDPLENITPAECVLEGFPGASPSWLRDLLLTMKPKKFKGECPNRIEFKYAKECPYCNYEFWDGVDVCDECEGDFGDCDGSCGDPECGNQHCQHCNNNTYGVCCPGCREPLPIEMWE